MKQSENRVAQESCFSEKYVNESHCLYTLEIYTIWKSRVEISHIHILKSKGPYP